MICEICCGYQKSGSHEQNDEISIPLNFAGTICEGHIQKISNTFWLYCKYFTLMLVIAYSFMSCNLK